MPSRPRPEKKLLVWERDKWRCYKCGCKLVRGFNATVDHIKARSKGGSNDIDNLKACCRSCNQERGRFEDRPTIIYKKNE